MQTVDVATLPLLLTIKRAVSVSGLSRTELYDRLAKGEITGKKMKARTYVVTTSLLANIEGLPAFGS